MRLTLATALLLGSVTLAHAGQVILGWDYPLAWQQGTTYVLRITTLQRGLPTGTTRTMAPFTPQQCSQWPDPTRTPETLCGPVCLDPGDDSLALDAIHAGQQSDDSTILDLDLTSTSPCTPTTVVQHPTQPPPTSSSGSTATTVAGAAVAVGATVAAASSSGSGSVNIAGLPNMGCVTWAITGPCFCNPYTPCVQVEYWEPGWLIETVKRPGTTALDLAAPLMQAAFSALGVPPFGGGGAGNATGAGHTNLQYNDVHVMAFPQLLGGPCTGCAPNPQSFQLNYASELDPAWRTAIAVPSPLDLIQQIGVWAHLYPRGGKAIHGSEPVGSGIAAMRGMDIAFQPVGTPPNVETHVVLAPTGGRSTCCQLASPVQTPCFPAGTPPMLWESGTVSPRGTYVWIFWRKRSCCVHPNQSTCGITLPGVGGYGANGCLIPSTP